METIKKFIKSTNWDNSSIIELQGDASTRKYYRVTKFNSSALIMDVSRCQDILKPFLTIAAYLNRLGYHCPEIYEVDYLNGLALIEDFGNITVYKYLESNKKETENIYKLVLDLLITFREIPVNSIFPKYNNDFLIEELMIFTKWYMKFANICLNEEQINSFINYWKKPLSYVQNNTKNISFVHKDFHGGNLMILPSSNKRQQIGIIDFQSAKCGNQIYDLISFLNDCRQYIPSKMQKNLEEYFMVKTKTNKNDFNIISKILIVQRNLKILGNFSNIYINQSNPLYLKYIDNVWLLINNNINIEILKDIKYWLSDNLRKKDFNFFENKNQLQE